MKQGNNICERCNGQGSYEGKVGGSEGVPESDVLLVCNECGGTGKPSPSIPVNDELYEQYWYYWVVFLDTGYWQPAQRIGKLWAVIGTDEKYTDEDLGQIGEKIPSHFVLSTRNK